MRTLAVVLAFVGLAAAVGWIVCAFLQPPLYVTWPVWGVAIGSMISAVVIHGRHP